MSRTQVRLQQITGSIGNAVGKIRTDADATALANITASDLTGSLSQMASAIGRIHGKASNEAFENAAGTFYVDIVPSGDGTLDLGTSSAEFAQAHVNAIRSADTLDIDANSTLTIDASGGAIAIGGANHSNAITVGADGTRTITIGKDGGSSTVHLRGEAADMVLDAAANSIAVTADGFDLTAQAFQVEVIDGNSSAWSIDATGGQTDLIKVDTSADKVYIHELEVDTDTTLDNLTVNGNFTVLGTTSTIDSQNLLIEDKFIGVATGSSTADVDSGIIFHRATSDLGNLNRKNGALYFDGSASSGLPLLKWGVTDATADSFGSDPTDVTDGELGEIRLAKLSISGSSNYLVLDETATPDFNIVASSNIVLKPTDNKVLPDADKDVDLGASGTAFKGLYLGEGANGTAGIFLDDNADTSIRASADDEIMIEIAGSDSVKVTVGNGSAVIEAAGAVGVSDSIFLQPSDGNSAGVILNGLGSFAAIGDDVGNDLLQVTGSAGAPTLVAGGALGSGTAQVLTLSGSAIAFKAGASTFESRYYAAGETNYVGFKAPSLSGNQIWALPTADGSPNYALVTDGSGNLSWADPSGASLKKSLYKVTAQIPAGQVDFVSSPTAGISKVLGDDLALSSISDDELLKKVEVYVNGALLISGSSGGNDTDYTYVDGDSINFAFGLEVDDIIQIIAR